jgi:hypothetical protein
MDAWIFSNQAVLKTFRQGGDMIQSEALQHSSCSEHVYLHTKLAAVSALPTFLTRLLHS